LDKFEKAQMGLFGKPQVTVTTISGVVTPTTGNVAKAYSAEAKVWCESFSLFVKHKRTEMESGGGQHVRGKYAPKFQSLCMTLENEFKLHFEAAGRFSKQACRYDNSSLLDNNNVSVIVKCNGKKSELKHALAERDATLRVRIKERQDLWKELDLLSKSILKLKKAFLLF
jgi:hypothetical protein